MLILTLLRCVTLAEASIAGHYNRPDIFNLQVNRQRQAAAVFKDDEIMKLHSD